ncbi:MAG: spermine synthase [Gammaproteobacteria bacterium]|nr:MAG: spermine synthase [Gammaproteobacteria bacterium]
MNGPRAMATGIQQRLTSWWLAPMMLASGLAGIAYEVLYGRMLGNLIGDQFIVSASVLITFLLGIGLGSRLAWRAWRWLWLIELAIGAYALAFSLAIEGIDRWLYTAGGLEQAAWRAMALLLPPSLLIGCSVPLFAGYIEQQRYRRPFARAYAFYNLGAAATALAIEFLLLRQLGIRNTVWLFAAINLLIALVLRHHGASDRPQEPMPAPMRHGDVMTVILIGIASAIFQLLSIKWAEMLFGPFRESFAIVLSIVLLGIAAGAWLVGRTGMNVERITLIAAVGTLIPLFLFEPVAALHARLYPLAAGHELGVAVLKWACMALLMGAACLAFGALLPALAGDRRQASIESGRLLFISSLANVAGFVLMAFVLHERLDYGLILLCVVFLCLLAASLRNILRPVALALLALALLGWKVQWDEKLLYLSYTSFRDPGELAQARAALESTHIFKGRQDVFSINIIDGEPYFFINGYTSIPLNNPSEKVVGALGAWFSPRHEQALVLGLGSGATATVVGQLFAHTDVVEINPVVRSHLHLMRRWNFDIEHNSNVDIHVDDAIHFLKRSTARYDLILNTVTTPLYFSSSKLYTLDFLNLVSSHLSPDGLYVTWMDSRIGDAGADIILRTLHEHFAHCSLAYVKSAYFLFLCSDAPIVRQDLPALAPGHTVHDDLLKHHGIVSAWIPDQLIVPDAWALLPDARTPINTLDRPVLEFSMAHVDRRGIPQLKRRILEQMSAREISRALQRSESSLAPEWLWHAWLRLEDSDFTLAWQQWLQQRDKDFRQKLEAVIRDYDRRLQRASADADVFHHFGYVMMQMDYIEDAMLLFRQTLKLDPLHDNTHFNLATCHEWLGQPKQALDHYLQEYKIDPNDEDVPWRIGRVLAGMNRWQQALPWLERAAKIMGKEAPPALGELLARARTHQ